MAKIVHRTLAECIHLYGPDYPLLRAVGYESDAELQIVWSERARRQLETFVRFCQNQGLLSESILPRSEQMPLGFELRVKDVNEAVLFLILGGAWEKWLPNWPWPPDPVKEEKMLTNVKVLERGLIQFEELRGAIAEKSRQFLVGTMERQSRESSHSELPFEKFEDASWHSEGDFPEDLDEDAAATHGGMYVAWLSLLSQTSKGRQADFPQTLQDLMNRTVTPGQCFLRDFDGKLTTDDLNGLMIGFTKHYYLPAKRGFYSDYMKALNLDEESFYAAPDTWETFNKLAAVFDKRLKAWSKKRAT
jgi:hypothetical protein